MSREAHLKKGSEFAAVHRQGRGWSNPLLLLRALPNQREHSRFGFQVSRRVGKAVVRNKARRRLREILRREPVENGWDIVLAARARIAEASFQEIEAAVRELLRRGRLQKRPVAEASLSGGSR